MTDTGRFTLNRANLKSYRAHANLNRDQCRLRDLVGIAAEKLDLHRQPRLRAAPVGNLRYVVAECPRAGNAVTDAQKLGHTEGEPADLRQQGAHGRVRHTIHRRQDEGRDTGFDPGSGG